MTNVYARISFRSITIDRSHYIVDSSSRLSQYFEMYSVDWAFVFLPKIADFATQGFQPGAHKVVIDLFGLEVEVAVWAT